VVLFAVKLWDTETAGEGPGLLGRRRTRRRRGDGKLLLPRWNFMARGEFPAIEHLGDLMANNEYRRYVAECLLIADGITSAESRMLLLL
jgi:hypothetical protein